eukprot:339675-Rhodomonas_salina.1
MENVLLAGPLPSCLAGTTLPTPPPEAGYDGTGSGVLGQGMRQGMGELRQGMGVLRLGMEYGGADVGYGGTDAGYGDRSMGVLMKVWKQEYGGMRQGM